jgi:hypothetical protein
MAPQRRVRARDVAPEYIEPFVPVVECRVIVGFEARPTEPEHLHVVAEHRADHGRSDMTSIGNALCRRELAPDRGRTCQDRNSAAAGDSGPSAAVPMAVAV